MRGRSVNWTKNTQWLYNNLSHWITAMLSTKFSSSSATQQTLLHVQLIQGLNYSFNLHRWIIYHVHPVGAEVYTAAASRLKCLCSQGCLTGLFYILADSKDASSVQWKKWGSHCKSVSVQRRSCVSNLQEKGDSKNSLGEWVIYSSQAKTTRNASTQ